MYRTTLSGLLLTSCLVLHAQEPDTLTLRHKNVIGVDATSILEQFFNWGGAQSGGYYNAQPHYLLIYKRSLGSWRARIGFGGRLGSQTDTAGPNSTTDFDARSWSIDVRAGVEKATRAGRKWVVYYGVDLAAGHSFGERIQLNPNNQSWDRHTEVNRFGGGPLLGFQFHITEHLSLATEASVMLFWERIDHRYWDPQVPGDDEQAYSENGNLFWGLPSRVYLAWDL